MRRSSLFGYQPHMHLDMVNVTHGPPRSFSSGWTFVGGYFVMTNYYHAWDALCYLFQVLVTENGLTDTPYIVGTPSQSSLLYESPRAHSQWQGLVDFFLHHVSILVDFEHPDVHAGQSEMASMTPRLFTKQDHGDTYCASTLVIGRAYNNRNDAWWYRDLDAQLPSPVPLNASAGQKLHPYYLYHQHIRELVFRYHGLQPLAPTEITKLHVVYLARPCNGRRCVTNDPEVFAYLQSLNISAAAYGLPLSIEWFSTESLGGDTESRTRAQVTKFRDATLFIAIHGAAHTNMLFMPRGATVVEIMPPDATYEPFYSQMARTLGLYHDVFVGSERGPGEKIPSTRVDMAAFRRRFVAWTNGVLDRFTGIPRFSLVEQ
jgi:hypothetical protein